MEMDPARPQPSPEALPETLPEALPEPWMRGPIDGLSAMLAPVVYCFQHAREDLTQYAGDLTRDQLWARPHGFAAAGFHIRHAGGAADRLCTYLEGRGLSEEQLLFLKNEMEPGASFEELYTELSSHLMRVERLVRTLDPACLAEPRTVGRKQLPSTVIGLMVHICEHTQRHVGQAIAAAKLARLP
jgi:hypothetical protein